MNSGAMRIHSKGHFQGGIQVKNEKNRPSLKSLKTDNRTEKSKYKPLWGKVFYLDLPSVTISEKLQKDIKDLGGRVEEFLSKDISYLISNKKEAKFAQTLGRISPVPSPESAYTAETTSPHPSHDGSSFKSPDSDFIPSNSILSNALSWGVKILHIDDIRYYIEQKKKELYLLKKSSTSIRDVGKRVGIGTQKTRRRLKKPFVKVEDMSQLYRPFYLQMTNMPIINYSIQKPCSPYDVDKPSSIQKQTQVKLRLTEPVTIKYSVGSLSPVSVNVLKKSEPKEKLELQHISQTDFRENCAQVIKQNFLYEETQEPEQKLEFISESIPCLSQELRGLNEKMMDECSMLSAAENDIQQNFAQLPPHKNNQECILDISEHKLIINEKNLEELRVDHCPFKLQASIKVSHFNTDNSASQPKQKSDTALFLSKDIKEKDLHSVFGDAPGLITINSKEHLTIKTKTSTSPPEELNECDVKNMDNVPSSKIHRKVRILLGRNKKENLEPNAELDKKRTEFLITQEENRTYSSPVQSLMDLFQTSEEKSEFLGFTSYTENSGICNVLDIWEEEGSNSVLTFFSSSTSTFTGF
ncbi:DBF4 zinc finger [Ictidomys tridecemlineatus]|nr:DBF4 zinc finger [Ictidomys tridecemlineatus]